MISDSSPLMNNIGLWADRESKKTGFRTSMISRKIPLTIKIDFSSIGESITKNNKIQIIESAKQIIKKYYNKNLSEIYGVKFDNEKSIFYIVFIDIVIKSDNELIKKISEEIKYICSALIKNCSSFLFEIVLNFDSVFEQEEDVNKKYVQFDIHATKKLGDQIYFIKEFSESDLIELNSRDQSENRLSSSCERFDFIIDIFRNLDNGNELFRKHILIFCSAYVKYYSEKIYSDRKGGSFDKNSWIFFARSFGAKESDAETAYFAQNKFAYTILTLEEILRQESEDMNLKIEKYNRELFIYNVRNLMLSSESISDDSLWRLFSEYIRRDHFFAEKEIYVFSGVTCKVVDVRDLRPIANKFVDEIKSVRDSINIEESDDTGEESETNQTNKMQINKKVFSRCEAITNPFMNQRGLIIMKDACAQYLNTEIKKGSSKNSVCFRDLCVVYSIIDDEKNLEKRKPFMEDHFLFSTEFDLSDFGKNEEELQALIDVELSLKKMFVYEENILFFKCWLGSIYTRNPERCGLFLYGKKKNAKSAILNALIEALGPKYGKSLTSHMFYPTTKGGVTCDPFWADAEGMLVGTVPEGNSKALYSSVIFKETTGGDMRNTAAKNKDPITYKNSAKIAFMANSWVLFDVFDPAVISRLYPLMCYAIFEEDPKDVPETLEEQLKRGIFHAQIDYYNNIRKRALLHLSVTDYFDLYKKHGLKKTIYMEREIDEWKSKTSDYAKFFLELEKAKEGEIYRVPASELKRIFVKRFNKLTHDIDLASFMEEFEGINNIRSEKIGENYYYNLKHKEITNYQTIYTYQGENTMSFDDGDHSKMTSNFKDDY